MKFYEWWRSSSSWRVRWALALKGVKYESVMIDLGAGQQHGPEFGGVNPMNTVPCVQLDSGEVLSESVAIIEWLDETHPAPPLLPRDPLERARVRRVVQVVNSGIQPLQNPLVYKAHSPDEGEQNKWAQRFIRRGMGALEKLLAGGKGRFCFGDAVTMADLYVAPQCRNAERQGLKLSEWPRIEAINRALLATPEAKATHPDTVKAKMS